MSLVHLLVLVIVGIGTLASTVYLALLIAGAVRFRRLNAAKQASANAATAGLPPVTLLKPLHGSEPDLRRNLASFFAQDYPAGYEVIFAARQPNDAGLLIAREVAAEYPQVPAKFVVTGEPPWPNAKVWSLKLMLEQASHEALIITDSDVWVAPDYLRNVVAPLVDPHIGLVTCVYRGRPMGGLWSRLEALGMSVEMSGGVFVADMLEGMKFALGPSMSTRKEYIRKIGGAEELADYCADDFILGARAEGAGYRVELSHHVIDHCALHQNFASSMAHQVRWMRSTRFSRPAGHLGTGLTFPVPFAILAAIAALFSPYSVILLAAAIWNLLNPVLQAFVMGSTLPDAYTIRRAWLYPARNLLGFIFWCTSYASANIEWRQHIFELYADGKMRLRK